jgi:hypothetical protein
MLNYNMVLSYQTFSTPTYFLSLLYHATSRMIPLLPPSSSFNKSTYCLPLPFENKP